MNAKKTPDFDAAANFMAAHARVPDRRQRNFGHRMHSGSTCSPAHIGILIAAPHSQQHHAVYAKIIRIIDMIFVKSFFIAKI
jgi:hypothetical protein